MPNRQKPVVALDIDGTLGDYHGHFLRFAAGWLGREMPDPNNNTDGVPLYKLMRVTKKAYRECKLAYRQGGLKRSMPAYEYGDVLTTELRKRGIEIWICTTRPYLRLDNIDPDTREWLRRNGIKYDYMVYGDDKYKQLVHNVGVDNILVVVDDLPEQYDKAKAMGLYPLLRDQPYNRYRGDIWGHYRVHDNISILASASGHHAAWKEQHV